MSSVGGGTGGSLRRSARTPKMAVYSVGDLVEIQRGGTTLRARLVQLLTEGSSPNPRWLIRLEGVLKDEEVYERAFVGKVLSSDEGEDRQQPVTSSPLPAPSDTSDSRRATKKKNVENTTSAAATSGAEDRGAASDSQAARSSDSSAAARAKLSARETRSRRRQAIIEDPTLTTITIGGASDTLLPSSQQAPSNINNNNIAKKRKLTGAAKLSVQNKRQREMINNEECVKIKLLTGTLYLYRGRHRRAEFVRRV